MPSTFFTGSGGFGDVRLVRGKTDGLYYALKEGKWPMNIMPGVLQKKQLNEIHALSILKESYYIIKWVDDSAQAIPGKPLQCYSHFRHIPQIFLKVLWLQTHPISFYIPPSSCMFYMPPLIHTSFYPFDSLPLSLINQNEKNFWGTFTSGVQDLDAFPILTPWSDYFLGYDLW